ncbi:MAG TPA: endonuclease III [Nitrospiria bacterium]|jgi:endonuclease-3
MKSIDWAIQILKQEIMQWKEPIVGVVANQTRDPFQVLISCVLSLRTKDETTAGASERLFKLASTPQTMGRLRNSKIEKTIYPVGFYRTKAKSIKEICKRLVHQYAGKVPDEIEELVKLPGVGRKTANLVVTLGYQKYGICVDTHVHRISNRWGYVKTKTPEDTEVSLRKKLPKKYWMIFNDLLVPYGQNLCRPISPFCSLCKISSFCCKVGVNSSR